MSNDHTVKRWREDLSAWFSSLRFSGFTVLIVLLVIGGIFTVSPSLSTYVQQQRKITELRESVRQSQKAVNEADAEREKWKDPVYIRAQARDRLFYVMPGETQLSVIADVPIPASHEQQASDTLTRSEHNWVEGFAASFLAAGTAKAP